MGIPDNTLPYVTAIYVTHDSAKYIKRSIDTLCNQSIRPQEIIIVDSGSGDDAYLKELESVDGVELILQQNVGFSRANNIGYKARNEASEFTLFLNPDTFLTREFIEKALAKMDQHLQVGVLSGKLQGYDIEEDQATGLLDSTGIFRKIYGRWYDRGQRCHDSGQYLEEENVPALCGALLFCRNEMLEQFGGQVFDPDFFLYKEDIEFSLRVRKSGWLLLYSPQLKAYHCRGWKSRAEISFAMKKIAAANEILLYKKHPSPYICWAYFKYILITLFRI